MHELVGQALRRWGLVSLLFWTVPVVAQDASVATFGKLEIEQCGTLAGCDIWMAFRRQHTAPYQAVAIKVAPDRSAATVILSEPPPTVSPAKLEAAVQATFGDRLKSISVMRMRTGLDGWLADLVFNVELQPGADIEVISGKTLKTWTVPADLAESLWGLHALMYGTTDGFWIDDVATEKPKVRVDDLKIGPQFLLDKFADSTPDWRSLEDPAVKVTTRLLKAGRTSAAYQRDDGLVVLALPQRLELADTEVPFRRFAVASDLFLGAVRAPSGALLLVGRARALPLSTLPPLRWETFTMLTRNRDDELFQSYERRRIFAGKIQQPGPYKNWDWAPILLSQQLDDTEFGTLLNQADQILKSWSQRGEVRYLSWQYDAPDRYPFGDMAASDYFLIKEGAMSLVFNWNTSDFGTIVEGNKLEVLSADRIGVLPILYLPGDTIAGFLGQNDSGALESVGEREAQRARGVFAEQGDAVLARVAQLVLLGQAVHNMLTISDPTAPKREARSDRTAAVLEKEAQAWLARVLQGTEPIAPEARAILEDAQRTSGLTTARFASYVAGPLRLERDILTLDSKIKATNRSLQDITELHNAAVQRLKTQIPIIEKRACIDAGAKYEKSDCFSFGTAMSNSVSEIRYNELLIKYRAPYNVAIDNQKGNYNVVKNRGDAFVAEQDRLGLVARRFERLSGVLEQASDSARLDRILPVVLAANQNKPSAGWIQTPSVVLSQNDRNVQAIGGHNARLKPSRARLQPGKGLIFNEVNGEKLEKGVERLVDLTPTSSKPVALSAGDGTLFAGLQGRRKSTITPQVLDRFKRESAACANCDRSYFYENGTIFEVASRPPPLVVTEIPAKRAMAGRLSDAGRGSTAITAQFVNFPRSVIADMETLANQMRLPPDRRLPAAVSAATDGGAQNGQMFAFLGSRKKLEMLEVDEPARAAPLFDRTPIAVKNAKIETPSVEALQRDFGDAAANADAIVVISFGTPAAPGPRLAIAASANGDKATLLARLSGVVRTWLLGRSDAPLAQHVLDLRRTLIEKLGPGRYEDFLQSTPGSVKIVTTDVPSRRG